MLIKSVVNENENKYYYNIVLCFNQKYGIDAMIY